MDPMLIGGGGGGGDARYNKTYDIPVGWLTWSTPHRSGGGVYHKTLWYVVQYI